jgi:uncharacterized delta-60 repeat protein
MTKKILIAAIAVFSFASSPAQNYYLDTDYGTNGKTVVDFPSNNAEMASMAIQPDGKVITCGSYIYELQGPPVILHDLALARFDTDGLPDLSFGINGVATIQIVNTREDNHNVVKVLDDGKLLVLVNGEGIIDGDFMLVRLNPDGSRDMTFGSNGTVSINFGGHESSWAMQVQPEGKIVVGGSCSITTAGNDPYDFSIARLNADGSKDLDFGTGGLAKLNFGDGDNFSVFSEDVLFDVLLQPDGKIVAAGFSAVLLEGSKFALLRLNADGTPDADFGNQGRVLTDFTADDESVQSIARMPDGKLIATGIHYYNSDDNEKVVLAKYNTNGSLDADFGDSGTLMLDDGNENPRYFAFSSKVTPDGKLLVCGGGGNHSANFDGFLVRISEDGTLDTTVGENGWLWADFGEWEITQDMVLQQDDKLVMGATTSFGANRFLVWRYQTTPLAVTSNSNDVFAVAPNPFTNYIDIRSRLMEHKTLTVDLIDISGRLVSRLASDELLLQGQNSIRINMPETLSKGTYFLKINDTKKSTTLKILK